MNPTPNPNLPERIVKVLSASGPGKRIGVDDNGCPLYFGDGKVYRVLIEEVV